MSQKQTRKLSLDEIATIIEETVTETEKDLQKLSGVLLRIAKISLLVADNLRAEQVDIEIPTTRSLQTYGVVTQSVQTALSKAMDRSLNKKTV